MEIGENWLKIHMLPNRSYIVITKDGDCLASVPDRKAANVMCCAMCIPRIDKDAYPLRSVVYLSFHSMKYHVYAQNHAPSDDEIRIGTITEVIKCQTNM